MRGCCVVVIILTLRCIFAHYATDDAKDEGTPRRDKTAHRRSDNEPSDGARAECDNGIFALFGVVEHAPHDAALVIASREARKDDK